MYVDLGEEAEISPGHKCFFHVTQRSSIWGTANFRSLNNQLAWSSPLYRTTKDSDTETLQCVTIYLCK